MKHYQPITQHHILCQSFWGNSHTNNLVWLRENIHQAIHTIFQDDTPIMRLRRLLETDKRVMIPSVYLTISNTLKRFEWIVEPTSYEEWCIDIDRFYKRLSRNG